MKRNIKRIFTAAIACCMLLNGCGAVNPNEAPDAIPPEIITQDGENPDFISTGESKKRSGTLKLGTATTPAQSPDSMQNQVTTAAENIPSNLPVFSPPTDGRVVINTNVKPKTTAESSETTGESTETQIAPNGEVIEIQDGNSNYGDNNDNPEETQEIQLSGEDLQNLTPYELIEKMTLKQKVSQMFIVKPEALTGVSGTQSFGDGTKSLMNNYPVGGIICFSQNLSSSYQTQQMLQTFQEYSKSACGVGAFTAIDEEGGTVARAAEKLGTTSFMDMAVYGELNDSSTAYSIGNTIGWDLRNLGFNLDFAPVADVNINPYNELGNRIFSSDPEVVANMASSVARGLQDAGVSATLKHFPGLGAEAGDTHNDSFVTIDRTVEQLRAEEFVPFRAGINAGVDFVMVGHQITTGFGDNLPADLSYTAVTQYLRNELGFSGLVITDSQEMNTISTVYGAGDAAIMSIRAGVDVILMPADFTGAVEAVCNAVNSGNISEEIIDASVLKILNQKQALGLF